MSKGCQECGGPFKDGMRREAMFCSAPCRVLFNNRRAVRGAEMYDLFMAMRYERKLSIALGVWAFICKLAQSFKEEDDRNRAGRKSWGDPGPVMSRKPWLRAIRSRV